MKDMHYLLPMFPLGTPLLPGRLLPLRIFEPRYVALLRHCLQSESPEFGVVLIERGFEVGGGDQRTMVGTVASILEAVPRPTGDFGVISYGKRRIHILKWLPDDPHPWAQVEDWPDIDHGTIDISDPDGPYQGLVEKICDRAKALLTTIQAGPRELEHLDRLIKSRLDTDPTQLSFALSGLLPFGAADQNRLLRCNGVLERLRTLLELLDDLEAIIQFQQSDDPFI
jgi:Lon protease-like protein